MSQSQSAICNRQCDHPLRAFAHRPSPPRPPAERASTSGGCARRAGGQVRLRIEDHDRERSRPEFERASSTTSSGSGFVPDMPAIAAFRAGPCDGRQSDHPRAVRRGARAARPRRAWSTGATARGRRSCGGWARRLRRRAAAPRRGARWRSAGRPAARATKLRYDGFCRTRGLGPVLASARACDSIPVSRRSTTGCSGRSSRSRSRSAAICWCAIGSAIGRISSPSPSTTWSEASPTSSAVATCWRRPVARFSSRACSAEPTPPTFLHHPLILGADGEKLSKSRRDTGLRELRAAAA